MGLTQARGPSTKATGVLTASTASVLSFPVGQSYAIVSNASASVAYFKFNDNPAAPTVSPTNFDFVLFGSANAVGSFVMANEVYVTNVSVYSAATSGIGMVGW